jgi:hypothetical protein
VKRDADSGVVERMLPRAFLKEVDAWEPCRRLIAAREADEILGEAQPGDSSSVANPVPGSTVLPKPPATPLVGV